MPAHLRSRGALRVAVCLSFVLSLGLSNALLAPAFAAEPKAEFAVSAAQMKTLGVTLLKLEQPAAIAGMAYAAKVTLPPGQEQVVSAPVAGVVDQLLVGEQQVVKAGQPLLRLNSPQFGEMQLKLLEAASRARLSQKTLQREKALLAEGIIPERRVQEAADGRPGARGDLLGAVHDQGRERDERQPGQQENERRRRPCAVQCRGRGRAREQPVERPEEEGLQLLGGALRIGFHDLRHARGR